ncbi:MAG: UvrD-helicase domain-containing protein, partial [Alphaproteobacteria bacterium]|nr:UvrD-helicase domain-containing protein [Alphaproteobacteria bacterium]
YDLIVHALKLLSGPGASAWVMYKLDGGIDHVLVDEAQDTSAEQWAIVRALTEEFFAGEGARPGGRSLFVVGDLKQSIFRFQGAEPSAFEDMQVYFRERARAAGLPWEEIELAESFRSTAPVLQAVDKVFSLPEAGLGVTGEQQPVAHVLTREGAAGRVEVWPLLKAEAKAEGSAVSALPLQACARRSSVLELAELLARSIAQWLDEGVELPALGRAVHPGDIMVLVRRRGVFSEALIRQLKRHGVPVAGADRMQLTDNLAVQDMLALAAFLLMPEDDLTLAALLKTPLFDVDEPLLFALCHGRGPQSVWQRLWQEKQAHPAYAHACEWLAFLLERADRMPPFELLSLALNRGGRTRILGRMGEEYAEALDELLNQALAFEENHPPSLQGFVRWIGAGASEIRRDMEQGRAQVRVMTVHGAKGLEAPVVVLPDTTYLPQPRDRLLWHDAPAGAHAFWPPSAKEDCSLTAALRQQRASQELAEHWRLLYVAMTRATEHLIICGWEGEKSAGANAWHRVVWRAMEPAAEKTETPAGFGLIYQTPQATPAAAAAGVSMSGASPPLPPWATRRPAVETAPGKALAPSRLEEDLTVPSPLIGEGTYRRGALLHRMLQYLPDLPAARRREAARQWAEHFAPDFSVTARQELALSALGVIDAPQFAPLFAAGSMAEVPVAGMVVREGKNLPVAAQIDRLVVREDEVWIIDFKTHTAPPAAVEKTPRAVALQLGVYRELLAGIFPGKTIRCAVLWTSGPTLMELPAAMLNA